MYVSACMGGVGKTQAYSVFIYHILSHSTLSVPNCFRELAKLLLLKR